MLRAITELATATTSHRDVRATGTELTHRLSTIHHYPLPSQFDFSEVQVTGTVLSRPHRVPDLDQLVCCRRADRALNRR